MTTAPPPTLPRRVLAEFCGTAGLVTAVVGSGIMAQQLAPGQPGLQLLANSTATALALAALILTFGPISGAHLNPVVSVADWWLGRRTRTGLTGRQLLAYTAGQTLGGITGTILANLMFDLDPVAWSTTQRTGGHRWLGEIIATTGLILLVLALARSGRTAAAPAAVGAYIGAAYWFTSSTSFANPAVTLARTATDTFAGIAPTSAPAFLAAQTIGFLTGAALTTLLYPRAGVTDDVVPHHAAGPT